MMQVIVFLAEYTEELLVVLCSLIIVLLIVTLHRMKRITKMMQGIVGNTKEKAMNTENKRHTIHSETNRTSEREDGTALLSEHKNTDTPQEIKAEQQELISAVLEEVFPS